MSDSRIYRRASALTFGVLGLLGAAMLFTLSGCAAESSEEGSSGGEAPPRATAALPDTTAAGAPIMELAAFDLDERRGEVTLLNFWATWCAPCRAEIPDLIKLQQALGDEGLQIIGIATDMQGGKVVRPFAGKLPINYPIVIDAEGQMGKRFGGVWGLPTTFVIGPDGAVVDRVLGIFPIEKMKPQLKEMLTASAGTSFNP